MHSMVATAGDMSVPWRCKIAAVSKTLRLLGGNGGREGRFGHLGRLHYLKKKLVRRYDLEQLPKLQQQQQQELFNMES